MKVHLAARETFAVDKVPACQTTDQDFLKPSVLTVTHIVADVTCLLCQRTNEFKRAVRLGLKDNDQIWEETL